MSGPTHGTLRGHCANRTYTPAPDYNGPDSFTFKVSDGSLESGVATVTINVTPANDAPTAHDDSAATIDQSPITVPVLVN